MAILNETNINLGSALGGTGFAPITGYTIPQMISTGLSLLFIVAAIACFFFLLMGGIQWILAGGDKEGLEKARKKISGALIGITLVFSVYAIATIVDLVFFGGSGGIFKFVIPTLSGSSGSSSSGSGSAICSPIGRTSPGTDGKTYICKAANDPCPVGGRTYTYSYVFWCPL